MTYVIIKVGDESAIFANANCPVRVLLDWLRDRVESLLPPLTVELDLCDDNGNMRLLTELPATTNALSTLQQCGIYHPVVRQGSATSSSGFRLLQPPEGHDRRRELQQRINRGIVIWERLKQKLSKDPPLEKLLEMVHKAIARSSKGGSLDGWERARERGLSKRGDRRSSPRDSTGEREYRVSGSVSPDALSQRRSSRRYDGGPGSLSARGRRTSAKRFGSVG